MRRGAGRARLNSEQQVRTRLLLEGPVLPTLLRLSAPNFLNLFSIAALITFDGVFVGRLGTDALAGASPVNALILMRTTDPA